MTLVIKLALTAIVLLAILWKVDFTVAIRLVSTFTGASTAGCLLLLLFQRLLAGLRLAMVMSILGHRLGVITSSRLTLEGMFFNQAFISFLGGDAYRIWRIHGMQVPLSDATAGVVLDRMVSFIVNHLAFIAMLSWVFGAIEGVAIKWGLVVLAMSGLGGIAFLLLLGLIGRRFSLIDLLPSRWRANPIAALLIDMATIGRHILGNIWDVSRIGAVSALMVLINCLVFYIILRTWDVSGPLALRCAFLVPGIMEISLLPLSLAGWGLREGASILGFGALGLDSTIGLAASVMYGLLILVIGLLGGLVWLFNNRSFPKTVAAPSEAIPNPLRGEPN